jgi:DNA-directed RNA polymerases I, II, and III subunit RPABC2
MSDDEAYEEVGDAGEAEYGEDEEVKTEEEQTDEEAEQGLDIEAAGTDESSDEEAPVATASRPAKPEKTRADPLLRASNKPRVVHLVADEDRVTDNRLQKTEMAAVLAWRAKQIADKGTHFVDSGGLHDPVQIAVKELYERRCPLSIRREIGTTPSGDLIVEEWKVREMTLPPQPIIGAD